MDNRRKLVRAVSAAAAIASLLAAIISTRALSQSSRYLAEVSSSLRTSDLNAAKSIGHAFARTDELTVLLARQRQPRGEWNYLLDQLKESFVEFLEVDRHESVLPHETAKANYYLGRVMILQGNQNAARRRLEQAVELAVKINDNVLVAQAKNTLGCLAAADGDYGSAHASFRACSDVLNHVEGQENVCAIALRNLGLVERALGRDGTAATRSAIALIERSSESESWGLTSELLQDLRMTLCEMYWSQGLLDEAVRLARETQDDLQSKYIHVDLLGVDKHLIARNRHVNALRFVERNLAALQQVREAAVADPKTKQSLGKTVHRWQWHPLMDLRTELVSNHLSVAGTMVAEFESQSGLVLAWGELDFSHAAATAVAKHVYDRTQLVIVSDSEESLDEARIALVDAGVPLSRVRFGICDCETPWFRDQGPIVSRSESGDAVWFDSSLTRGDRSGRVVLDALPTMLRRNWKTRVADVPIHLEGGMLLSNGNGLAVGSAAIVRVNREYGFSDEAITRELRRVTGARRWLFLNTLIGEPTEHIDLFMTFVSPTTVVVGEYADRADPNAALLDETATLLSTVVVDDTPLRVVRIPMPDGAGTSFPSYTNVVFANGVLLVPSYSGESKEKELKVKETYEALLPDWEVHFVDCTRLRHTGGALHCLVSNLGDTPFTPVFSSKQ
ncbi:Agmatine deiminase [Stieleria neptunia]|uniref:Agmatine deiminase n=1 Tax=Stieleria neptunia TaxID=2527979 RepID=A0A518HK87_9BACT|nr:agmatine deiminase family protein [Stieleria neptunia]QDV41265.1 Agmatine deiminase [Stieleria neptunia]